MVGETGIGIRSPVEESWPLLLCDGGDVGPSLLAENPRGKTMLGFFPPNICLGYLRKAAKQRNSRVPGFVFRPRLRLGVDAGEDIVVGVYKEEFSKVTPPWRYHKNTAGEYGRLPDRPPIYHKNSLQTQQDL